MTNGMTQEQVESLGAGFRVESFDELWTAIGRLPFVSRDGPYAFRGVPDSSFRIRSSLYRRLCDEEPGRPVTEELLRQAESQIIQRARDWGLGGSGSGRITDLQLLAQLQHHGVPTRLLDLTANPLTALWFACASMPTVDGLLIAFNVSGYDTMLTDDMPGTAGKLDDPVGFELDYALRASAESRSPFLVRPTFLDARMSAQEGFFIASACPPADTEWEYREVPRAEADGLFLKTSAFIPESAAAHMLFDAAPEFDRYMQALWCFVIPAEMKQAMLPVLDSTFNRRAAVLFPDFAGFRALGFNANPLTDVPQMRHIGAEATTSRAVRNGENGA